MSKSTVFFGIDPGTVVTGFGVIKTVDNTASWLDSGIIVPGRNASLGEKLETIFSGLTEALVRHCPVCVCVEEAFYGKNVHSTLMLGMARGVALLAAQKSGASVVEFSPLEIKKSVVGNGNATKDQVEFMVKAVIAPPNRSSKSDEFDALAAALCAFYHWQPDVQRRF
jgi:crossover junction endodeoxyribonuclease RuvC